MDIGSLCEREVVGIDADAPLRDAAALMCEEHVGALVVTTGDEPPKVVGVVTDRDLAIDVLGRDGNPAELRVGHLAKTPPVAVNADASLGDAAQAMERAGVRRLLVVQADGGVVGLVSADDLVVAMTEDLQSLARALRSGIAREKSERKVIATSGAMRPVYPAFGTIATQ